MASSVRESLTLEFKRAFVAGWPTLWPRNHGSYRSFRLRGGRGFLDVTCPATLAAGAADI
ncbi:MAG: hypothetical protein ACYSW4_06780 [Planctomycetota bacterium]